MGMEESLRLLLALRISGCGAEFLQASRVGTDFYFNSDSRQLWISCGFMSFPKKLYCRVLVVFIEDH